jgi:putative FmdB family regulatory protein
MPLYEYKCSRCGETFEVLQKFSDAPLKKHAGCGGAVERVISPSALQFKGTGWYVTDYARGSSKSGSNGKEASAAKPAPAQSKPAESKPSSSSSETTKS